MVAKALTESQHEVTKNIYLKANKSENMIYVKFLKRSFTY